MRLFVLIPTFRETTRVQHLVLDLEQQTYRDFEVAVVNSDPGDPTSAFLGEYDGGLRVTEIAAHPGLFWTGALNRGLEWVLERGEDTDYCLFLNCDVRLEPDFLQMYCDIAKAHRRAVFCPLKVAGDRYVSSGLVMKSWLLSLTDHKVLGCCTCVGRLAPLIPVDMLAGTGLLFPVQLVREAGRLRPDVLPHYGGDYEFSARAKRHGYGLYVTTEVVIKVDAQNTGRKPFSHGNTLAQRLTYLRDIRSPLHLGFRTRFVWLTYPSYAVPVGLITTILKTLIEAIFGRSAYLLFRPGHVVEGDAASASATTDTTESGG